jgi:hypothetical protein
VLTVKRGLVFGQPAFAASAGELNHKPR